MNSLRLPELQLKTKNAKIRRPPSCCEIRHLGYVDHVKLLLFIFRQTLTERGLKAVDLIASLKTYVPYSIESGYVSPKHGKDSPQKFKTHLTPFSLENFHITVACDIITSLD